MIEPTDRAAAICSFYPYRLLVLDAVKKRAFREYRRAQDVDWAQGTDDSAYYSGLATRRWSAAWEAHRLALCEWLTERAKCELRWRRSMAQPAPPPPTAARVAGAGEELR